MVSLSIQTASTLQLPSIYDIVQGSIHLYSQKNCERLKYQIPFSVIINEFCLCQTIINSDMIYLHQT